MSENKIKTTKEGIYELTKLLFSPSKIRKLFLSKEKVNLRNLQRDRVKFAKLFAKHNVHSVTVVRALNDTVANKRHIFIECEGVLDNIFKVLATLKTACEFNIGNYNTDDKFANVFIEIVYNLNMMEEYYE